MSYPTTTTIVHQELQTRPSEFPLVDSENTLTDFNSIQQQLISSNKPEISNLVSSDSIIRLEKTTTTTHNFYDVEKLGDETARNSFIHHSSSSPTTTTAAAAVRPFGMGNPGIIGKYILVTPCTCIF